MKKISAVITCFIMCAVLLSCGSVDERTVIDLAAMNDIVRSAEINNINASPEKYVGKTIVMKGMYVCEYKLVTDTYYHYLLQWDDTQCCMLSLEFVYNQDRDFPGAYPEYGTEEVKVSGVFAVYTEGGNKYYYINADTLKAEG